tara:strand:+ start:2437 stop:3090 length:654 start_codon:yes stop_codon:yes gene_type:complete
VSKEVKIEGKLDKHLKPLQIDGKSLPVEVAEDDIRINQGLNVEGDINAKGNLNIQGNEILFENNTSFSGKVTDGRLSCQVQDFEFINPDGECQIFLVANSNPQISFLDSVLNRYTMGVTSNVFTIGTGLNFSSPELQLDNNGLEVTGSTETTTLILRELANSFSDEAGHAQLWVKNDTPNNLYFTNDAGDDVQITNGASLAGGSSGLNPIIASMIFG